MNRILIQRTKLLKLWRIQESVRCLNSNIPPTPVDSVTKIDERVLPPRTIIDKETIELLERLSLVNFANEAGIKSLEEAIRFADCIRVIDTTGVEPLISVLEERNVYLRDDKVTDGNCRNEIMANAAVTEEEYFVAPPGNIPMHKNSE